MTRLFVDAYAWIEYLTGRNEKVKRYLENIENELFTCSVTISEVISKVKREGSDFEKAFDAITALSQILDVDVFLAKNAGIMHADMKRKIKDFGLADAFILAAARQLKTKILTGDEHFKDIKDAVFI